MYMKVLLPLHRTRTKTKLIIIASGIHHCFVISFGGVVCFLYISAILLNLKTLVIPKEET